MCKFALSRWRAKGQIDVAAMAKGFFSFTFNCKDDLVVALTGGPWSIGKSSLMLKRWEPGFNLKSCSFSVAPVWVRLPGLPLEFWDEEVFKGIASTFGVFLLIDQMMKSRKHLVYARFCVNVEKSADFLALIKINSKLGVWEQAVKFDSNPFSCFYCQKVGH